MAVGFAALAGTFRQSATKKQLGRCQLGNAGAETAFGRRKFGAVERLSHTLNQISFKTGAESKRKLTMRICSGVALRSISNMQNPLIELSHSLATTVAAASASVVAVSARKNGYQSGILIDSNRILTVDHGVEIDEEIQILLPSGQVAAASLLGRDSGSDLALLQLTTPYEDAPVLALAGGASLGELVIVISRSPETGANASLGMLSALSGAWRTWKGGKLDHFLRLDLPLYPGISGSVALRADGTVLGLITSGLTRGAVMVIPASNLHHFVETIEAHGELGAGYLGVGLQPVPQPAGMIVLSIEPNSPSAAANLMVGDVILFIGGEAAADFSIIQEFLEAPHVGQQVPLRVCRAGNELDLQIEIGRRPTSRRIA